MLKNISLKNEFHYQYFSPSKNIFLEVKRERNVLFKLQLLWKEKGSFKMEKKNSIKFPIIVIGNNLISLTEWSIIKYAYYNLFKQKWNFSKLIFLLHYQSVIFIPTRHSKKKKKKKKSSSSLSLTKLYSQSLFQSYVVIPYITLSIYHTIIFRHHLPILFSL